VRSTRVVHTVESHTEGMPTRVVTGGVGVLPGDTMFDRRRWFMAHSDGLRRFLMNEPRGHSAMSGAILQPPTRPDADFGVLYIEVSGCLPMCGHGTIGVATVLVETGMVEVVEPVTTIRLDTPAGLVVADVHVVDGAARTVTLRNVPSFLLEADAEVEVPGFGTVRYDQAFGGNFYAVLPIERVGLPFDRAAKQQILDAGLALMEAINTQRRPVHPDNPEIAVCHHVQFVAPGSDAGTRWPSTPAGSTGPRAAPAPAPGSPSSTPGASFRSAPTWSTRASSAPASSAGRSRRRTSGRRRARTARACRPSCLPSPAGPG